MNEQEEVQQNNMISNLPLLFANGYPTSLDKITESQLEKFIPFMVQCSLGHINLQGNLECSEPEWWPEDLPFEIPFTKPSKFIGNWKEKMKEIIIICYQFHKSVFLLRFCCDLASYEQASLRFINNYNSTTSLFDRRNNKLLVTFRNENMSYDQPFKNRKCLMQQKTKTGNQSHELQHTMVEQAPFDIYLCDYCDAELYSKDAILEHEKICNNDDDVILCDSPQSDVQIPEHNNNTKSEDDERRIRFLLNFNLQCRREKAARTMNLELVVNSLQTEENISLSSSRKKRLPKRNRTVHSLARSPTIPLSSPAGLYLVKTTKTSVAEDYITERLDRVERFCSTPLLTRTQNKPKFFDKKTSSNSPHCTFRKPQEYSSHIYVFPRRQFSQRRRIENYLFFNALLMKRCRPISVRLKKISDQELKCKKSSVNSNLNIKLTRDTTQSSNWKISNSTTDVLVETIDLCSSEDEESSGLILKEQFVDENLNTSKCLQSKSSFEILATKKLHIKGIHKELPLNKIFTSNAEMQLNNSCCDPTESTEYKKVNQTSNPLHHAATTDTTIKICISGTADISCIASPPVASQNLTLPYLIQPPNNYQNVYKKNGVVSRSELTNESLEKPFTSLSDRPSMASFLTTHNKQKFGVENSSALAASTLSLSQSTQSFSSDQHGKMLADISLAKQLPSSNCIVSIDLTT